MDQNKLLMSFLRETIPHVVLTDNVMTDIFAVWLELVGVKGIK